MVISAEPRDPFDPLITDWDRPIYRVYGNRRRPGEVNPGLGASTRWAFFGDPPVPVLYAAESEEAAVAETILHDVAMTDGWVFPEMYLDRVMARLACSRTLRLARFGAGGLRRLHVRAAALTATEPDTYDRTVPWADAAHSITSCDGIVWMSRHWNTSRAIVLFGDRVDEAELRLDAGFARAFVNPYDIEWLAEFCDRIDVGFVPPRG